MPIGEERQQPGDRVGEAEQQAVLGDPLDLPGGAADVERLPDLLDAERRRSAETTAAGRARHVGGRLERRDLLPREVGEVEAQVLEHRRPALPHLVEELVLPVGAGAERAADDAHHARAAGRRLDEELGDERA